MAKANILIVEDERIVAMDIQNNLERAEYRVVALADSGEEAVEKARELRPDLILMDISLKGEMDGIEAATRIRTEFHIPVIFLTAFADQSTLDRARLAEPFGYLLKPFEERDLTIAIEMALYKHSMENKLRESEDKFRKVIENASDGIAIIDKQGRVIEWNLAMEKITGLKSAGVIGRPLWDVIFQTLPREKRIYELRESMIAGWKESKLNGKFDADIINEYEVENVDGTIRIVQSSGFTVETAQGTLGGVIMRDITEFRKREGEIRKLSQAVEQSANTIVITDINGKIEYANPKFTEISGYTAAEALGKTPRILRSGEHSLEFYQQLWQTIKSGKIWRGELHNRRKNNTLYWEAATITPVYDRTGKMINFIAVKEDITARKELEQAERDQRQLAEALRDTALTLNSTLNLDDVLDRILINIEKIVPCDAAMVSLFDGEAVRNIRYRTNFQNAANRLTIGDLQASLLNVPILKSLARNKQSFVIPDIQEDARWKAIAIPGMQRIRSLVCAPIQIHDSVIGVINIISAAPNQFTPLHGDRILAFASQAAVAIENAQLYEQAKHLSTIDPLTELFNMRYFMDFSNLEFERSQRYGRAISIAMVDIDHFKTINDSHGHSVGDSVLRETADRIKKSVRAVDVVARYGGEEFVILMPETGVDDACQVAERIRQAVETNPIKTMDAVISITLSAGVAEKNDAIKRFEDLVRLADRALYKAKGSGKNKVEKFPLDAAQTG